MVGPTSHGVREGRGRAARYRIAILTAGDHRVAAAEGASRGENRPFGQLRAHRRRADADLDVSHRNHGVADRMKVPLGIGSRSVRPCGLRSGAALADSACEAAVSGGLGRRVRPLRTHADVEIVGYRSISTSCMRVTCILAFLGRSARTSTGAGIAYFLKSVGSAKLAPPTLLRRRRGALALAHGG